MTVIFRVAADGKVGLGHLRRCITLAEACFELGLNCIMLGPSIEYARYDVDKVFCDWISVDSPLDEIQDANNLINIYGQSGGQFVVLDGYAFRGFHQQALVNSAIPFLMFDIFCDKFIEANIVVNPSPGAHADDYMHIFSEKRSELLIGPKYALIPGRICSRLREKEFFKMPGIHCLILMGGGDDKGSTGFVINSLKKELTRFKRVSIVAGRDNPNLPHIRQLIKSELENGSLHIDPYDISSLYLSSNFAIMAGGTSTFEAAYFKIPMLILSIAKNQTNQAKGWEERGYGIYAGELGHITAKELDIALNKAIKLIDDRAELSQEVDGKGGKRISVKIEEYLYKHKK